MYLHVLETFWTSDYHVFKESLDSESLLIFEQVSRLHYEEEEDAMTEMKEVMAFFLEELYPNNLVYCESDSLGHVSGWVFELPREIQETVRTSLDMPREDLPGEINTKNPLTKMITDWRLKNG